MLYFPGAGDPHDEKPCSCQCDCGGSVLFSGGSGIVVHFAALVDDYPSLRTVRQIAALSAERIGKPRQKASFTCQE
jgi:hypothetical protein